MRPVAEAHEIGRGPAHAHIATRIDAERTSTNCRLIRVCGADAHLHQRTSTNVDLAGFAFELEIALRTAIERTNDRFQS
jgi:hypothetical protein